MALDYNGGMKRTAVTSTGELLVGTTTGEYKGARKITLVDGDGNEVELTSGGSGGGFKLYDTTAELLATTGDTIGESAGNLETGTYWKWNGTTWVDTSKPIPTQYDGYVVGYDDDVVDVVIQNIKNDAELIELFGIVTSNGLTISINQTAVNYGVVGTYNVIIQAQKNLVDVGLPITLKVNVVELINLNVKDLEEYTIETSETDVTSDFPLVSDLSQVTVTNTSGINPTTTTIDASSTGDDALLYGQYGAGTRYEWVGVNPDVINQVTAEFSNVVQFANEEYLKMNFEGIDFLTYSDNPLFQKWGFEVYDSGILTLIQRGFIYIKVKVVWYRQLSNKLKAMDMVLRFDDVQARKVIYKPVSESSEFLVNSPTKLLADVIPDRNNLKYVAVSKFDYNASDDGTNAIKTAIRKHSSAEVVFGFGKYESGSRNTDYSADSPTTKYERVPITFHMRDDEIVGGSKYQAIALTPGPIPNIPTDAGGNPIYSPVPGDEVAVFPAETLDGEYLYRLLWSVRLNEGVGSDLGLYGFVTVGGVVLYSGKFSTVTDEDIIISGHTWNRFKASPVGSEVTRDIDVYLYKLGESTASITGGGVSIE